MRSNALPCADGSAADWPGRVAQEEHRPERRFEIARFQLERIAVLGDVGEERAGEAVGLLFQVDGLLVTVPGTILDPVAPLVREDERDRERAERLREAWHQRDVVVGDEVALQAVERVAVDVGVAGCGDPGTPGS